MTATADNLPQFRIGLLLDNTDVSKPVHDFVQWAQAHKILQITHLILLSPEEKAGGSQSHFRLSPKGGLQFFLSGFLLKAITVIERLFLLKNERHHNYLRKFNVAALVPNTIRLDTTTGHPGDHDADLFKPLNLDLIITFGSRSLKGEILSAARLGVISVHYGDDRIYRGGPAGFWEVFFREDTTGFTVQHLTGTADGSDETLVRGNVGTQFYYLLNQAALCEKTNHYVKKVVERIAAADELPSALANIPFCNRPHGIPRPYESLSYLVGLFRLAGTKVLRKAFSIDYQWSVGFVQTGWRNAALWRATIIKNPPQRYLADPFVARRNGKSVCYVEDYDKIIQRARISVYELKNDDADFIGVAIEEGFHLSFPYLFEYQSELYMCPESSEKRDIRIYKCIEFPLRWQLEKIIMKDVSAVDTMLFEKDGKWWMLTNIAPGQLGDFQLELHLFSANSPLADQWAPHPQNPIFIDASRARNAGMIREGDRLFRVAQRQGFDFYGKATSINEIRELDDTNYIEDRICSITPTFQKGGVGTHHLHSDGKITVFDFAR